MAETNGEDATPLERLRGLAQGARAAVERLPGVDLAQRQLAAAETLCLQALHKRLAQLDEGTEPNQTSAPTGSSAARSPAGTLQGLMERSLNQRPDKAEQNLFLQLLDQLVPDEARILAAVSDGGSIPVCHLDATNRLGTTSNSVIAHASRVGNEAGVMLGDRVPYYVGHLHELGLLDIGPEDKSLATKYEMIENDSTIRDATSRIENEMHMRARLTRGTAYLSPLGQQLWEVCQSAD